MGRTSAAQHQAPKDQGNLFAGSSEAANSSEHFSLSAGHICRTIKRRDGSVATSLVDIVGKSQLSGDLAADFDISWLKTQQPPPHVSSRGTVVIADLFAGCGAMSAGVREACRALELSSRSALAVESDAEKLRVYGLNFPEAMTIDQPIETLIDGDLGSAPTVAEMALLEKIEKIDILIGGPPCQGHSDLNNFTRRSDPRNALIIRFARAVELFRPAHLIIENVQGIRHDRKGSLHSVEKHLRELGYQVDQALIECSALGVPQRRRRFFMVGSRTRQIEIAKLVQRNTVSAGRTLRWACEDLLELGSDSPFDTAAVHSIVNQNRIKYLFEHSLFDLPDEVRPDCHRLKIHAYRSVYGRLRWDEPAPTITTGFGSTGQGRFVHPLKPRTLTPHEAARLQLIPDFFSFGATARTQLQKMIGNAVPPKVPYFLALELLR